MEPVEHDFRPRQVFGDGLKVRLRHVDRDGRHLSVRRFEPFPEGFQCVGSFAIADKNDRARLQVQHHAQVFVSLANADFIDRQVPHVLQSRPRKVPPEPSFFDVADGPVAQAQVAGHILQSHAAAQINHHAFEAACVRSIRVRESNGHDTSDSAVMALDPGNVSEDGDGSVADRRCLPTSCHCASSANVLSPARGATRTLRVMFDSQSNPAAGLRNGLVFVAANSQRQVQYARGHAGLPDLVSQKLDQTGLSTLFPSRDARTQFLEEP